MQLRPIDELVDADDPAWPQIAEWAEAAVRAVDVLPGDDGAANLLALQVTTRSILGALAYETGGLLIDGGWLRVLGGGSKRLPRSLASWNRLGGEHRLPGALLVADDAVGGFFAINGGGLSAATGDVCYFAPDTCAWESLDVGFSAWLEWTLCGDLNGFYDSLRWPGWRDEIAGLDGDLAILFYPPLWTEGAALAERSRKDVAIAELWELQINELAALFGSDM